MEGVGTRIKDRSKLRQSLFGKRKKIEETAVVSSSAPKKRKCRRRKDSDSDIEDITPVYYYNGVPLHVDPDIEDVTPISCNYDLAVAVAEVSDKNKHTCLDNEEDLVEVSVDLLNVPSSSAFGLCSVQNTCLKDILSEIGVDVENSASRSSSGSENRSEQNKGLKNKSEIWGSDGSGFGDWSEKNRFFQNNLSKIQGLDSGTSVASSSGFGNFSEENTLNNLSETRDLYAEEPVSNEIEIVSLSDSDSDSETEKKASAKKKLFEESSDEEDGSSEETEEEEEEEEEDQDSEDDNPEDEIESLSSSSSSSFSSSSDEEFNSKEVIGDTADDDMRKDSSPIRNVSRAVKRPVGRPRKENKKILHKLSLPVAEEEEEEDEEEESVERLVRKPRKAVLTKPIEENEKIHKLNCRVAEEEAVKSVTKKQSNDVLNCNQCGTGIPDSHSSFIRQHALRDENDAVNNFASTNVSKCEDSVSINSGKSPEKPSISRPEMENPEPAREVKTPEKPSTSRPEVFVSLEKPKEVQVPVKPSTSRPEVVMIPEKVKEVQVPVKPFTSRPKYVYPEKAKEFHAPEKPSTFRPEYVYSEKEKEVRAPEKSSTFRPEHVYSEKAKEFQAEKPSRLESILCSEKAKEVQAKGSRMPEVAVAVAERLNKSVLANEPVDIGSDSSINSADDSGYESEPSRKEKEVTSNNNPEWRMLDGSHKEVDLFRILVNSVWQNGQLDEEEEEEEEEVGEDKHVSSPEDQSEEEEEEDQRKFDDDGFLIVRPPPVNLMFGVEEPESPPVLSELEIEEANLWEEMAFCSQSNLDDKLPSNIEKEMLVDETPRERCQKGNHELCLDLEIGMKCIHCSFLKREIRSIDVSEWGEKIVRGRRKTDRSEEEEEGNSRFIGNLGCDSQNKNSSDGGCVSSEGTVWDKIPGIKAALYPHQQEGFEFIWRNLAGTIMLNELKNFENSDETGGCIMSHAPGTGKTRLTIMFLQSYLECFPDCKAVIIAPASLLLTWAEEFNKWEVSVPFHNLSSLDFSGKENSMAFDLLMQKNSSARTNNEIRMVKIYSWIKSKSILGISYNLYEKLAGVRDQDKKTAKPDKELDAIREILMGKPGLLVLDEAHTPRNQRSCIWKTLSKVETQKRILLSGTPFQNNFQELCNVLGLARPKFSERLQSTLKKSGMAVTKRGRKGLGDGINNRGIQELKAVMFPFVHVHKGSILQSSLFGLRECVVVLNPPELQKRVLESIEVTHNQKTKNVFETEHKLSLVSVHPSLVSHCTLTAKERLTINEALLAQLKKVRLDPNQSVKTKFLMEFIGLCDVVKEKVLVFSQYIDPLKLIMKHLVSRFKWNEGVEVLYMHGKLEQKQRQMLINEFNDPESKAKVFLASTKACSEGISLVGASRVILLDVVWNPAVERQAISRAYRIGQKKIVYTYHLVAKGTPEGPKYCKQAQKDRISELVFACSSKHDKGKEKIEEAVTEDKLLDTMVKHMKLGDMFDNLIVQPKEAALVEGFDNILMP